MGLYIKWVQFSIITGITRAILGLAKWMVSSWDKHRTARQVAEGDFPPDGDAY